jgi:hypothetical protein
MKRAQAENNKPQAEYITADAGACELSGVKKCLHIRPIPFAACTLLLVLIIGFVFQASGLNMWRLFVSWDNETMEMIVSANGWKMKQDYVNDTKPAFDDAFFHTLEEMDMHPLLPSWMPDGFALERIDSRIVSEDNLWAMGAYTCGDRYLSIYVFKNTSENSGGVFRLEKDERKPDIFDLGGIKFYVMDNLGTTQAFWFDLPYIINITGYVNRDELKHMINSMFERK